MKKYSLLIVGESPAKADPEGVLANSQSGRRLEKWLDYLGVDLLYRVEKVNAYDAEGKAADLTEKLQSVDAVLALGTKAEKVCKRERTDTICLPHPSGLNRRLNDQAWLESRLNQAGLDLADRYVTLSMEDYNASMEGRLDV